MKKILFVCVENSCRSQMAEGLANNLGKGIVKAYSAGSKPSGKVNPNAINVMKEIGIDISVAQSKGFCDVNSINFDYAVTLGCKDTCPFIPADKHIEWDIEDPVGKSVDVFIATRDAIEAKVSELMENLVNEIEDEAT